MGVTFPNLNGFLIPIKVFKKNLQEEESNKIMRKNKFMDLLHSYQTQRDQFLINMNLIFKVIFCHITV